VRKVSESPLENEPAAAVAGSGAILNSARTAQYLPVLEALVVGIVAGLSAVILLTGTRSLSSWRLDLCAQYSAYIVLPAFGLVGGLLSGLLVHFAPEVSGSGIPQVRALLNRIELKLDLKSAIVKLVGGIIALGSGLFMGREGPTVQVGAALAAQLSRWLPTTAEHRRQIIAAGAGAGLAAAFNAPLAGVTFILEELLKEVTPQTVSISLIACFSAAVVENLFGNARAQSAISHAGVAVPVHINDIIFYVVLGWLCALFGALFNMLILGSLRVNKQMKLPTFVRTAFAGLLTGIVVASLPTILHNYDAVRQLINSATVPSHLVPLAFVSFFFLVLLAYGSGAPGGLFAPTLVLGAALGYLVGYVHWQMTGTNLIDIFTEVGMGAFFAAVARVPLTATVIVFEMSGNFGLIPPLMIASVIASSSADRLSKGSLYDLLMVWSGIQLRGPKAAEAAHSLRVSDVLARRPAPKSQAAQDYPLYVSPHDKLEDILFLFVRYGYEELPVKDDKRYLGVIDKQRVLDALFPKSQPDTV
jgi:chloride channel protein, CIC family